MSLKEKYGIYEKQKKIIAIGDLHGDILQLLSILIHAKLIKKKHKYSCINNNNYSINNWIWIGKNTYLIQLGDIFDGGGRKMIDEFEDNEVEIYNFLIELKSLAQKEGGNVLLIIGNHEIMNFNSKFKYVQKNSMNKCLVFDKDKFNYIKQTKTCNHRQDLFSIPNGPLAKSMFNNSFGIIKIGSNIFCHGGITFNIASKFNIKQINMLLKGYLAGKIDINNKFFKGIYGYDNEGIIWYRGYSKLNKNEADKCSELKNTLGLLSADRMIVGHTVQKNGITTYCEKKSNSLWAIDVGLSRAFDLTLNCQYLVIENDKNVYIKQCAISKEC